VARRGEFYQEVRGQAIPAGRIRSPQLRVAGFRRFM